MPGYDIRVGEPPPTPIVGLIVVGSLFILAEALALFADESLAQTYGVPFSTLGLVTPTTCLIISVLLFSSLWMYVRSPSWGPGVIFIVLGIVSFFFGAGFVVGGILVVVGGSLACYTDWVQQLANRLVALARGPSTTASPGALRSPPEETPTTGPAQDSRPASGTQVVVYRPCPSCGELNPPESTICSACGKAITP